MILAGDIGGTKTRLAVIDSGVSMTAVSVEKRYRSRDFSSLEDMLHDFLNGLSLDIKTAAFGVAGPVFNGRCEATNLAWTIEKKSIQTLLGSVPVILANDLETTAYGIRMLPEADFSVVNPGVHVDYEPIAILAVGTGLGEAALIWSGLRYKSMPSEGGHCDFAPRNELEIDLLRYLQTRLGEHVSYERVLSGSGKILIYEFLRDTGKADEPDWLREALKQQDPSPLITELAISGRSELCRQALELFVSILGAEAGNLALKFLSRGGVFLGGGVVPSLVDMLKTPTFLNAFCDKGRFKQTLRDFPVQVILNERASLFGAAYLAHLLISEI